MNLTGAVRALTWFLSVMYGIYIEAPPPLFVSLFLTSSFSAFPLNLSMPNTKFIALEQFAEVAQLQKQLPQICDGL